MPSISKKSSMPVRLSDILNITGTDTFLAGGHSLPGRDFLPCKIRLQRRHTGIDQQQAVVIMGHQREAFHHQMALAFKKSRNIFLSSFTPYLFTFLSSKIANLSYYKFNFFPCQRRPVLFPAHFTIHQHNGAKTRSTESNRPPIMPCLQSFSVISLLTSIVSRLSFFSSFSPLVRYKRVAHSK